MGYIHWNSRKINKCHTYYVYQYLNVTVNYNDSSSVSSYKQYCVFKQNV